MNNIIKRKQELTVKLDSKNNYSNDEEYNNDLKELEDIKKQLRNQTNNIKTETEKKIKEDIDSFIEEKNKEDKLVEKSTELKYWENRYQETIQNHRKAKELVTKMIKEKETCRANIFKYRIIKNGYIRIGQVEIKLEKTKDDTETFYFDYNNKKYCDNEVLKLQKKALEIQK